MNFKHTLRCWIPIIGLGILPVSQSPSYAQEKPPAPTGGETWYNGDRAETIWFADDQLFILNGTSQDAQASLRLANSTALSEVSIMETGGRGTRVQLPAGISASDYLKAANRNTRGNAVRYAAVYLANSQSATKDVLIQSGEMVVIPDSGVDADALDTLVSELGLNITRLKTLDQADAVLYSCPTDRSCLSIANQMRNAQGVNHAYPNWIKTRPTRADTSKSKSKPGTFSTSSSGARFTVDDPLFPDQWHLDNTGQSSGTPGADVNIQGAWDLGLSGGTNYLSYIGIVDDGLEVTHEDLTDNEVSGQHIDLIDNDSDPTPGPGAFHGTAVGGIAAAQGLNATGVSGAAPGAGLIGIRLIGGGNMDTDEATALNHNLTSSAFVDIYNNSWGPADDGSLHTPGPLAEAALANGVNNGRVDSEGTSYGAIYVWAGGNGLGFNDNSNYDAYANSRYTIAVAASDHNGVQSLYSEPGANILVNTPSSIDIPATTAGTTTTDITGTDGYDTSNYTNAFGGTSSTAPLAAGIVALMLDSNSSLGWRDVQKILALTAKQNDPSDADWTQNGAGHWVNHKYGFGTADAGAAVVAAAAWTNLPAEVSSAATITPGTPIPDSGGGSVNLTIPIVSDMQVESVYLTVDSDHTYWGDLEIVLTSPDGTQSVLTETHVSSGNQLAGGFRFSSNRHLEEYAQGDWTVTITDGASFDTGVVTSLTLEVFGSLPECFGWPVTVNLTTGVGTPTSGDDVILGTPGDDTISAFGGDDFICGLGGDDDINAGNGRDAVDAGDGDDEIQGGGGIDYIFGGTGNDLIYGGPDNDYLAGEADNDILFGNSGSDSIWGGSGVDRIKAGSGDDIIYTGDGATVGSGVIVDGGAGNDTIYGGPDADEIRGSSGNDEIYGFDANDRLYGGGGEDTIYGGNDDDLIRGNSGNDTLYGENGDDNINGYGSKDTIFGGAGNDVLNGSTGNDVIDGESGDDTISGGGGNDTLIGGADNSDECDGGGGIDTASADCEIVSNVP